MKPRSPLPHSQQPSTYLPILSKNDPVHALITSRRSVLILSSHLRLDLSSGLFPSGFSTKTLYTPILYPYMLHALPFSVFLVCQNFICLCYFSGFPGHAILILLMTHIPPLTPPPTHTQACHYLKGVTG
jgi:hypothetical protein